MNEFSEKMHKEIEELSKEKLRPREKREPPVIISTLPHGFVVADGSGSTQRVSDILPGILRDLDEKIGRDGYWILAEYTQGVIAITLACALIPSLSEKGARFLAHDRINAMFFGGLPFHGLRGLPFKGRILSAVLKPITMKAVDAICSLVENLMGRVSKTT